MIKDKFDINLLRLIDAKKLKIESVEHYLKREGMENRKPFDENRFLNMLKNSCFPFEGGLSYCFVRIMDVLILRIDGGHNDPYYPENFVVWLNIQDGYTRNDIEDELNAAPIIDMNTVRQNKNKEKQR